MSLSHPNIIVCESGVRWAAAWRRCAPEPVARFEAVSELSACDVMIDAAPQSFVLLEVDESRMPRSVEWLARRGIEQPGVAIAVVGDHQVDAWRAALLERGAILVITSERKLPLAVAAAQRQLARCAPPELGFHERVRAALPWD